MAGPQEHLCEDIASPVTGADIQPGKWVVLQSHHKITYHGPVFPITIVPLNDPSRRKIVYKTQA